MKCMHLHAEIPVPQGSWEKEHQRVRRPTSICHRRKIQQNGGWQATWLHDDIFCHVCSYAILLDSLQFQTQKLRAYIKRIVDSLELSFDPTCKEVTLDMLARHSACDPPSRQAKKVHHMRKYLGFAIRVPDVCGLCVYQLVHFVLVPAPFSFTKYPDDPRFRIYRVFKKFTMKSYLVQVKQFSKSSLGI